MKQDRHSQKAHDIRTPLAGVKGFIDTMVNDPDMQAETRIEFLRMAQTEANLLSERIEALLTLIKSPPE